MNQVNIREARRRLTAIVESAQRGQKTIITRRGRQVAVVQPIEPKPRPLPDLTAFRASLKPKGKPLSQVVIEQRKAGRY